MVVSFREVYKKSNNSINLSSGHLVEGTVVGMKKHVVLVKVGLKELVPFLKTEIGSVSLGERLSLYLESTDVCQDLMNFNPKKASNIIKVPQEEFSIKAHEYINGLVLNHVNGGYGVAVDGVVAFLPYNQTITIDNPNAFVGSFKTFYVMHVNKHRNNIVLSRKIALERWEQLQERHFL